MLYYILIKNQFNLLLLLLAALKYPSISDTHSLDLISEDKSRCQSEEVIFENEVSQLRPKIQSRE